MGNNGSCSTTKPEGACGTETKAEGSCSTTAVKAEEKGSCSTTEEKAKSGSCGC